jgi:UDP-glucose 4-epimerase
VITGGAGFIGSHLADALVREAEVVLVDHMRSGTRENIAAALKAGATLVRRDILRGDLAPVLRRAQTVYHLAANPEVRLGKEGTRAYIEQNILATHRVLEACRAAKVPQVVFASTSTVYGEASEVPTPEDYAPMEPISLYGASKLACEALLSAYAHSFGMNGVIFRMANVVGGRSGHGVVVDLVRKLLRNPRRLEILGSDPGTAKSYVHIDDVTAGFRTGLAAADGAVVVYNLGSEDAISVRTLADALCEELGLRDVDYAWTGGAGGVGGWVGDVRIMQLSVDRLRGTGWGPRFSSEEAVRAAARDAAFHLRSGK